MHPSFLVLALLCACGGTSTASSVPQGQARVVGEIAGFALHGANATFVLHGGRGPRTPRVFVLVLSDVADPCAALQQGVIDIELGEHTVNRPGVHTLSWMAVGANDGHTFEPPEVGRFVLGLPAFEGPSPLPVPNATPYGWPVATTSDAVDCRSHDHLRALFDPEGPQPREAVLDLEKLERGPHGVAEGHFLVRLPSGSLEGWFRAPICILPERLPPDRPRCTSA